MSAATAGAACERTWIYVQLSLFLSTAMRLLYQWAFQIT